MSDIIQQAAKRIGYRLLPFVPIAPSPLSGPLLLLCVLPNVHSIVFGGFLLMQYLNRENSVPL